MRSKTSKPLLLTIALLLTLLAILASRTASAECKTSDPTTGLVCGEDVPDYPGWRKLCRDGCVLTTVADERAAQRDRKLAALVPSLRLSVDDLRLERELALVQRDRAINAFDGCSSELAQRRAELVALAKAEADRWSPWAWVGLGAGSTLVAVLGGVLTLVLL